MSKSSFINKKFVVIVFLLIFAVGIGVGVYFLLKPKADLKAPYNDTYAILNNQDVDVVLNYNNKLNGILIQTFINPGDKAAKLELLLTKYSYFEEIESDYLKLNAFLLDNLMFTKDHDGKMQELQKQMHDSYEDILEKTANCMSYINLYLTDAKIQSYQSNDLLWQRIYNYTVLHEEFMEEFAEFYKHAGQICKNYLAKSTTANPLSVNYINIATAWADGIVENIIDLGEQESHISISSSKTILNNFINRNRNLTPEDYFENLEVYNNLFDKLNTLNFEDVISSLANSTYSDYVNSIDDEQQKSNAEYLGKNYFLVIA